MKFRWRTALAAAGLLSIMGCASKGCSCVQPIPGGFPTAERHESAIQLRATQSLFQYLSQNGASLIPNLLPTGSTFNVPPSCGSNQVCCANPPPMCRINFDFKTLSLTPQSPNTVHLSTDLQLKTLDDLPVKFSGVSCKVSIDTTASGGPTMNVAADLAFAVNATTDDTEIQATNTKVTGIDNGDLNLSGGILCTLAGLPGIENFIISQLESQVATQIQNTVAQQACMKCTTQSDCNSFASACTSGVCVGSDGKTCIQELGLDGRMNLGAALASFSPGLNANLDVLAALGGYAQADTGLSLGMLGGGLADPHSPCVPDVPPPQPVTVQPSPTFMGNLLPDGTTPYHLGIGVHVSHLDTLGYAAWNAGALCLDVGTPTVAALSSKTISLVIPSLDDLTHGVDAPMFLVIRPQAPPTFTLGKGTFKTDMNGQKQIDDPLLHISAKNFNIDFYAFVDQRYVRIMTLGADLELPVSLDVDQTGKIVPLIGDLGKAFTNVTVSNSELLAEAPADLAQTFPMLLGVAGGQLSSALKPIALPALMGINLKPIAITSTDPDAQGVNQFLSIFADLTSGATLDLAADTSARLAELRVPPASAFSVSSRTGAEPTAILDLSGRNVLGLPLEYSYQVDGAGWSPFSETDRLEVTHPLLWLAGAHRIEVRARAVGHPETLDATPAEVLFDVTPAADTNGFHGRTTNPPASGCGCQLGARGDANGGALALVTALLFALALLRRRRGLLLLLGASALALTTLGCNSGLGKGDYLAPTDEVGRYSDLQVRNGVAHVSAYDDTVGDLAYAEIRDLKQPIKWQYIDGLADGVPKDMPGGYRHGITDPGPNVGLFTSLALTKGGDARIAYYDADNHALKYAAGPHPFHVETIDAGMNGVDVGAFTAISLDGSDVPTIAYMATDIPDGQMGFRSELRVAVAHSAHPESASDWAISTVDTTRVACGGLCPTGTACIEAAMVNGMPNGDPAQSTCVAVDAAPCPTMCADTQACIMGTCTTFVAPVKAPDLPPGTGLFTRALREKDGTLELVYYDHSEGDLKLATAKPDGTFDVAFIDGNDPSTDVGQFATARLADDGTLHVAYQDAIHDSLLYKTVSNGTPLAMPEVIDDGMRPDGPHPVGAGAALILDGNAPRVVYQDQESSDLLEATRGSGWMHQDLSTGPAGYGFYSRLAEDGGKLYLSQFVYDRAIGSPPIGVLQLSLLPN